jgi:hypothetical protein
LRTAALFDGTLLPNSNLQSNLMRTPKQSIDLVSLVTFNDMADAEALQSILRLAGIEAQIRDERRLQQYWFFVTPKAGLRVQVPKDNLERALAFLNEREVAPYLRKAVHCPSCNSCRIQYPATTRKNLLPTVANRALALLHVTRNHYYCEDCHFTWAEKPGPPMRLPKSPFTYWPLEQTSTKSGSHRGTKKHHMASLK